MELTVKDLMNEKRKLEAALLNAINQFEDAVKPMVREIEIQGIKLYPSDPWGTESVQVKLGLTEGY